MSSLITIGVISDTHGLLRPEALQALAGSHMILHAGDVGNPEILESLRAIAPVHAVRGNVDTQAWAQALPGQLLVGAGNYRITIVHRAADLALPGDGTDIVIYGHSHKPGFEKKGTILYFNPGSAGPRRFRLPVTCGKLILTATSITPEILLLPLP